MTCKYFIFLDLKTWDVRPFRCSGKANWWICFSWKGKSSLSEAHRGLNLSSILRRFCVCATLFSPRNTPDFLKTARSFVGTHLHEGWTTTEPLLPKHFLQSYESAASSFIEQKKKRKKKKKKEICGCLFIQSLLCNTKYRSQADWIWAVYLRRRELFQ